MKFSAVNCALAALGTVTADPWWDEPVIVTITTTVPPTPVKTTSCLPNATESPVTHVRPTAPLFTLCVPSVTPPPATAEYYQYLDEANRQLDGVANMVQDWSRGSGLFGALKIQQSFYVMSSAIDQLNYAADYVSIDRADSLNQAVGENQNIQYTMKLLSALAEKAGDFSMIGASQIIGNDIAAMAGPASQCLQKIIDRLPEDVPCDVVHTFQTGVSSMSEGFSHAGYVYGLAPMAFPTVPTACKSYC